MMPICQMPLDAAAAATLRYASLPLMPLLAFLPSHDSPDAAATMPDADTAAVTARRLSLIFSPLFRFSFYDAAEAAIADMPIICCRLL